MRIRVLFFGVLRDLVLCAEQWLELESPGTAGSVLAHYRNIAPSGPWNSVALAVNQQYASPSLLLSDGDEVALLPPVSGGSPEPGSAGGAARESSRLTREPIDTALTVERIKAATDGAVVVFDGIVRDNTRGRATLFLDYQSYEAMALDQMRRLAGQAAERFAVREALIVHRLGRLAVGETSVLIVVAAAHRAAAFEACRWLIDTLKTTVPIWKKEHFADGAVWADGELFPAGIDAQEGQP